MPCLYYNIYDQKHLKNSIAYVYITYAYLRS